MKSPELLTVLCCAGLIPFVFTLVPVSNLKGQNSLVAQSVGVIIKEVLSKQCDTTSLILPAWSKSFEARDFQAELLLGLLDHPAAVDLESIIEVGATLKRKRRSSVVVVCDFNDFLNFHEKLNSNSFKFSGFFVIAVICNETFEIDSVFSMMWKKQISNVIVVMKEQTDKVSVKTFIPFNSIDCNDTKALTCNEFVDNTFVKGVKMENFFPRKMENLHHCPIRISISNNTEPYLLTKLFSNGSYSLKGRDIKLINVLSKSLNFQIDYTFIGDEGFFFENKSAEGPLKLIMNGETDLALANFWLKTNRLKFFGSSAAYAADQIVFMVPPGRDLSAFEELVFSFPWILWLLIALSFILGVAAIVAIKHSSIVVQDLVFGEKVTSPAFNIYVGFIGNSQPVLPKSITARLLLMTFLMYTLVMRTVYQGSYFILMQSNIRHAEIKTIDEMIEKDFKVYAVPGSADLFLNLDVIKSQVVTIPSEMKSFYQAKIQSDSSFKGVYGISLIRVLYFNQLRPRDYRWKVCDDVLLTIPIVIYMPIGFYLRESINDKIENLKSAGLIDLWHFQDVNRGLLRSPELQYPEVLRLKHFAGSFYVLFVGVLISLLVFLVELALQRLSWKLCDALKHGEE